MAGNLFTVLPNDGQSGLADSTHDVYAAFNIVSFVVFLQSEFFQNWFTHISHSPFMSCKKGSIRTIGFLYPSLSGCFVNLSIHVQFWYGVFSVGNLLSKYETVTSCCLWPSKVGEESIFYSDCFKKNRANSYKAATQHHAWNSWSQEACTFETLVSFLCGAILPLLIPLDIETEGTSRPFPALSPCIFNRFTGNISFYLTGKCWSHKRV